MLGRSAGDKIHQFIVFEHPQHMFKLIDKKISYPKTLFILIYVYDGPFSRCDSIELVGASS